MKEYTVAILGATGAVGTQMIQCLEEQEYPVGRPQALGERALGRQDHGPSGARSW